MAFTNSMSALLDKIEKRLGTRPLNFEKNMPDLAKSNWPEKAIFTDTIPTFSHFFPNKITYNIIGSKIRRDGYYLIDEDEIGGDVKIIGVRDLSFEKLCTTGDGNYPNYYEYGTYGGGEDFADAQLISDFTSLFNMGVYIDFVEPNKIAFKGNCNANIRLGIFPVDLFIEHAKNLATIPTTMMDTFEDLATSDVAVYLYPELKYYDGNPSTFGDGNLKLEEIERWKDKREDIVRELKEGYVSAANKNQPMMFTI